MDTFKPIVDVTDGAMNMAAKAVFFVGINYEKSKAWAWKKFASSLGF